MCQLWMANVNFSQRRRCLASSCWLLGLANREKNPIALWFLLLPTSTIPFLTRIPFFLLQKLIYFFIKTIAIIIWTSNFTVAYLLHTLSNFHSDFIQISNSVTCLNHPWIRLLNLAKTLNSATNITFTYNHLFWIIDPCFGSWAILDPHQQCTLRRT